MNETWGLSGSGFLGLYLALLVAPALLGVLATLAVRQVRRHGSEPDDSPLPSDYHVAYLARGPLRAVETAIAALLDRGSLRAESAGTLRSVGSEPEDDLERVIFETGYLGTTPNDAAVTALKSPELTEIRRELELRRLIEPELPTHVIWFGVTVLYGVITLFGLVRWFAVVTTSTPIGFLSFLIFVAAGGAFAALAPARRRPRLRKTALGKQVLRASRQTLTGVTREVALNGGLGAYPDPEVAEAVALTFNRSRRRYPGTSSAAVIAGTLAVGAFGPGTPGEGGLGGDGGGCGSGCGGSCGGGGGGGG
ncbi:TIGR04222 domain-containing membrane protein [Amycolatopsis sp. 195334CR]|uniref:TIGR04222 domain-containing membrane protein n=1 Tax=Amycolatopsis sp. 195334CR TaxID=2814588 RepID=UPI001A8C7BEC|nr:TIGR04222 domain-containing membrane protein [Amycolatopsis sp. 195334CR]MBN6038769.1 TIGR04222 domain-containing membrane protein [Amycolatopsis sp. 195334CR]